MIYTLPLTLLELESESYHLTIESQFGNGSVHTWIIDTGASKTVFDVSLSDYYSNLDAQPDETIQSAGIGANRLDATLGRLQPFNFGSLRIDSMPVALIDLTHINALYWQVAEKQICGLIGSDFLLLYRALIDYRKMEMSLEIPD